MKPESGRILIDSIDISTVNTQTLRNRIVRLFPPPCIPSPHHYPFYAPPSTPLPPFLTHSLTIIQTFLAQEPHLFPGTIHTNLDPLSQHSPADCASVLHRIAASQHWTLSTEVEAGGKNLSQGQRQLVGLARAVLRRSSVIVLDEATASIDLETAVDVQRVLREELKESTVITIAHRLEAVEGADFYLKLDSGKLVEWGACGR